MENAGSNDPANKQPPTVQENPHPQLLVVGKASGVEPVLKVATGHCHRFAALPV